VYVVVCSLSVSFFLSSLADPTTPLSNYMNNSSTTAAAVFSLSFDSQKRLVELPTKCSLGMVQERNQPLSKSIS
jgi:hypothetical protein